MEDPDNTYDNLLLTQKLPQQVRSIKDQVCITSLTTAPKSGKSITLEPSPTHIFAPFYRADSICYQVLTAY